MAFADLAHEGSKIIRAPPSAAKEKTMRPLRAAWEKAKETNS